MSVSGRAHFQDVGDVTIGRKFVGFRGLSRRLEGFAIDLASPIPWLEIRYMAHLSGIGDTGWKSGGQFVGTRGESRAVEGFAFKLVGASASNYDVFYMAHLQDVGDTGLHKNGAYCGTRGLSRRVEGFWLAVVPRGTPFRLVPRRLRCLKTESIHSADKVYGLLTNTTGKSQRSDRFDLNDGQSKDLAGVFAATNLTMGAQDTIRVAFLDDDGDYAQANILLAALAGAGLGAAIAEAGNADDLLFELKIGASDVARGEQRIQQTRGARWNSSESVYELTFEVTI